MKALLVPILAVACAVPALAFGVQDGQGLPSRQTERDRFPQSRVMSPEWHNAMEEALGRASRSLKLWREGHHREALTVMLLAHRDLNEINRDPEHPLRAFDVLSGLHLASMYDELQEPEEAYEFYRRAIRSPEVVQPQDSARRADYLLCFAELCVRLKKDAEAKWAFRQIADEELAPGKGLKAYVIAAFEAVNNGRFELAERWARKALELEPGQESATDTLQLALEAKAKGLKSTIG